jgi:hypothetical protein
MSTPKLGTLDRRIMVGALAAAAAGLTLPQIASARAIKVRGMAGGGLAHFELSDASFSLAVTRMTFEDENRELVVGSVLWVDPTAGLTLSSTRIDAYGDLELPVEQGEGRRIRGLMSVNGADEHPFRLDVIDAGPPGSGLDSLNLIVGADAGSAPAATPQAAGGFSYAAAGPVITGDIQDIDFDLDTATAYPIQATPTV